MRVSIYMALIYREPSIYMRLECKRLVFIFASQRIGRQCATHPLASRRRTIMWTISATVFLVKSAVRSAFLGSS